MLLDAIGRGDGVESARDDLTGARLVLRIGQTMLKQLGVTRVQVMTNNPIKIAALETFALYAGMVKLWLADTEGTLLRPRVEAMIRQHVARRRREPALTTPPKGTRKGAK